MECHRRIGGTAFSAHHPDGGSRSPGDDSFVAFGILGPNGGGNHGRTDRGNRIDPVIPPGVVCGVVPGEETWLMREELGLTMQQLIMAAFSLL